MPIPDLDADGFLPEGVHACAFEELLELFGRFQGSDRRPLLARRLQEYLAELRSAGIGSHLIVNGSFVTGKHRPSDVDILLALNEDVDLGETVPPFKYNVRSKRYVRKYFEFDIFFGYEGDESYTQILDLFLDVKYQPGRRKGILRVEL
jgi:hypothetical protein